MNGEGSSNSGGGGGQQTQQTRSKRLVNVSKEMSKILRHNPPQGMDTSGWVNVEELMSIMKSKVTLDLINQVVQTDEKGRFDLDDSCDPPRIRATQGHSVQLEEPVLEQVTSVEQVPVAVHVTSKQGWESIKQSGQIERMNRTHIHFATETRHLRKNNWAQIFLLLDLQAALNDGIPFQRSTNGVLLSEGPVPVQYLTQVQRPPFTP